MQRALPPTITGLEDFLRCHVNALVPSPTSYHRRKPTDCPERGFIRLQPDATRAAGPLEVTAS